MNLEGTWIMTQAWKGAPPYKFSATFESDGSLTVDGGFYGMWTVLGNSTQVSLAIADFQRGSITAYNGNVLGAAMGGMMTGGRHGGATHQGTWSAIKQTHAEAPENAFSLPE